MRYKRSLYIALFVAFIDFMGIGLIYPLFSAMLFDCSDCLVSAGTSLQMRGILLGFLIALMPMIQFFTSPIWGALSDSKGRKRPLQVSLAIACIGYLTAMMGVFLKSILFLFASRFIIGFAAGNTAIVQATVADLSTHEEKARNFGLYSMALGLGFTLGPFLGGTLSSLGYHTPFVFTFCLNLLNLFFTFFFFKETHKRIVEKKLNWTIGIDHLRKAFRYKGMRTILLASFFHNFAWSYFFEFIPVYLITRFDFTSMELGAFYGVSGAFYALCTGLLIRPFIKRYQAETLFFAGNFLTGLSILFILLIPYSAWLWPYLFILAFFCAFVTPSSTTIVSNHSNTQIQGESLGVLSAVNAVALVFSPILSSVLIGKHPTLSLWVGGFVMLIAALTVLISFRSSLFQPKK